LCNGSHDSKLSRKVFYQGQRNPERIQRRIQCENLRKAWKRLEEKPERNIQGIFWEKDLRRILDEVLKGTLGEIPGRLGLKRDSEGKSLEEDLSDKSCRSNRGRILEERRSLKSRS